MYCSSCVFLSHPPVLGPRRLTYSSLQGSTFFSDYAKCPIFRSIPKHVACRSRRAPALRLPPSTRRHPSIPQRQRLVNTSPALHDIRQGWISTPPGPRGFFQLTNVPSRSSSRLFPLAIAPHHRTPPALLRQIYFLKRFGRQWDYGYFENGRPIRLKVSHDTRRQLQALRTVAMTVPPPTSFFPSLSSISRSSYSSSESSASSSLYPTIPHHHVRQASRDAAQNRDAKMVGLCMVLDEGEGASEISEDVWERKVRLARQLEEEFECEVRLDELGSRGGVAGVGRERGCSGVGKGRRGSRAWVLFRFVL